MIQKLRYIFSKVEVDILTIPKTGKNFVGNEKREKLVKSMKKEKYFNRKRITNIDFYPFILNCFKTYR